MTLREFYDNTVIDYDNYYVTVLDERTNTGYTIFCDLSFRVVVYGSDYNLGSLRVTKFSIDCESCFICVS